jgi:hypothetical protein
MPILQQPKIAIITDSLCLTEAYPAITLKPAQNFTQQTLFDKNIDFLNPIYTVDPLNSPTSIVRIKEVFQDLAQKFDYVIYLGSTNTLSDSVGLIKMALENISFRDQILIIDSKVYSAGLLVLKNYIDELIKEGIFYHELEFKIKEKITKLNSKFYTKNRFGYLHKNYTLECSMYKSELKKKISRDKGFELYTQDILKLEKKQKISSIIITFNTPYLEPEAKLLKKYLEKSLRYFNQVEVVEEYRMIPGYTTEYGIGVHIG